jgi:Ca-activated chloride channel homolog
VNGRHRTSSLRSNGLRALAAGMVLPLLVIAGVYGGYRLMATPGCAGNVRLTVAASPEIAPAIREAAARWVKTQPRVLDQCVDVDVSSVQSADVAAAIAEDHGVNVNGVGQADGRTQVPQVWIPDSSIWLQRMRSVRDDIVPVSAPSLARSPVVLALPEPTARTLGWVNTKLTWVAVMQQLISDTRLHPGIVDPHRDSAAIATLLSISSIVPSLGAQGEQLSIATMKSLLDGKSELPSALLLRFPRNGDAKTIAAAMNVAPLSEQAVFGYNENKPAVRLVALYPEPAPVALDFPFAVLPRLPADKVAAAGALQDALAGPEFRNLLAEQNLRAADGTAGKGLTLGPSATPPGPPVPVPDAPAIDRALLLWTEVTRPGRMLAVIDVSASMATAVPSAGGQSRQQVAIAGAMAGFGLCADTWAVGVWTFSSQMDGDLAYRQVVPIGQLEMQRAQVIGGLGGIRTNPKGSTGLYSTLLAAYKTVQNGWDPDRGNTVLAITDGRNDDPRGPSLDQLVAQLKGLVNADRPVKIIVIGIGTDVSEADLTRITSTTGGAVFLAADPAKIGEVFLRALALDTSN